MGKLYQWMKMAKEKDAHASVLILQQFEPKLNQSLRKTKYQERDDLKQELHIKLLEAMTQFNTDDVPGFFDYIDQVSQSKAIQRRR